MKELLETHFVISIALSFVGSLALVALGIAMDITIDSFSDEFKNVLDILTLKLMSNLQF